ncbi:uncharacterized protein LOC119917464 [Micropterus salmoides]|uniref:uncharacterized protein LOC119917464 n=1 Tax=Micropterus salmoides TaxID=27706 RepID=UPI0018EB16C1|nr:uncharacterized protein LOC119917464 [Micropterus salmoides]
MEKHFQPTWMQTSLNALKSDTDSEYLACNLTKVHGERRYLYSPTCNSSELDCISTASSHPAVSGTGSSKSTPGPGGLLLWEPVSRNATPLMEASCFLRNDLQSSSCMSYSTKVTESSWILRSLLRVTFSSNYLDPNVYQGYETIGCRYLYAPLPEISGFVDEGFPPCSQIHHHKCEPDVSSLESEKLGQVTVSRRASSWDHAEPWINEERFTASM